MSQLLRKSSMSIKKKKKKMPKIPEKHRGLWIDSRSSNKKWWWLFSAVEFCMGGLPLPYKMTLPVPTFSEFNKHTLRGWCIQSSDELKHSPAKSICFTLLPSLEGKFFYLSAYQLYACSPSPNIWEISEQLAMTTPERYGGYRKRKKRTLHNFEVQLFWSTNLIK